MAKLKEADWLLPYENLDTREAQTQLIFKEEHIIDRPKHIGNSGYMRIPYALLKEIVAHHEEGLEIRQIVCETYGGNFLIAEKVPGVNSFNIFDPHDD